MFNVLISFDNTAWETDQLMRMDVRRFKEYSDGSEAKPISLNKPDTLKLLEAVPALLMYERSSKGPDTDTARYGALSEIRVAGGELVFRFREEGRFSMAVVREFADRLDLGDWEQKRTHWAIKDGGIPKAMLAKLQPSYDVVLSFAGEDRKYVERVAKYLRSKDVKVFYDGFEEASLWGKDLAEHLDSIYRLSGQYCIVFISKFYAQKMWTRYERRSALARALRNSNEYILPARFDETELSGILPTVAHISVTDKTPTEFAKFILKKLGRNLVRSKKQQKLSSKIAQATAQQVLWGPVHGRLAGISIGNAAGDFVPWRILRKEVEQQLLPQIRVLPVECTAKLQSFRGRKNWIVEVIDFHKRVLAKVWFGTDGNNNWAWDGLVRVGEPLACRKPVWQVFQRYSDGTYRRIKVIAK